VLKEQGRTFNELSRVADLVVITASFAVAATVSERVHGIEPFAWIPRFGGSADPDASKEYALLFLIGLISWLAVSQWRSTYRSHRTDRVWNLLRTHTNTQLIWVMLTANCAFLFKLHYLSRMFFLMFLPLSMLLMSIRQTGSMVLLHFLRTRGFNLRAVLVVGDAARRHRFAEIIRREPTTGYHVVAQVDSDATAGGQLPESDFDEAFVLASGSGANLENVVLKLATSGKLVHLVPAIFDATLFKTSLDDFAVVPIISVGGARLSRVQCTAKRLVDVAGSAILLVVLSPVLILTAFFVKVRSQGSIFFTQDRLGENGRTFRMYKFRTMLQDAEERLHADPVLYQKYVKNNFKLPKGEDPRIAPGGNFLRSTSIDELPQLVNVLKGDMSLVGPRPIVPTEITAYGDYGPLFLSVKPGLTGYWQINGRSEVTDYSRRTALDIEYIRDQSFKTDVDILLRTIPAVLRRKGAH
jgi:exopolysaccharide production protein ExoY